MLERFTSVASDKWEKAFGDSWDEAFEKEEMN